MRTIESDAMRFDFVCFIHFFSAWNKRQQYDNMTPARITVIKLRGDVFTAIPYSDLFVSLGNFMCRRATAITQKNTDLLYKNYIIKIDNLNVLCPNLNLCGSKINQPI